MGKNSWDFAQKTWNEIKYILWLEKLISTAAIFVQHEYFLLIPKFAIKIYQIIFTTINGAKPPTDGQYHSDMFFSNYNNTEQPELSGRENLLSTRSSPPDSISPNLFRAVQV